MKNFDKYLMKGDDANICLAYNSGELKEPFVAYMVDDKYTDFYYSDKINGPIVEAKYKIEYNKEYTEYPFKIAGKLKADYLPIGYTITHNQSVNKDSSVYLYVETDGQVDIYYVNSKGDYATDNSYYVDEGLSGFTLVFEEFQYGKEVITGFVIHPVPDGK